MMNARQFVDRLFDDKSLESTRQVACGKVVFTATYEWLMVAQREGLGIDWSEEPIEAAAWNEACDLCGFDPNDDEVGFGVLIEPRPQDTLLRPGDIVATQGYGGDVVFFRKSR